MKDLDANNKLKTKLQLHVALGPVEIEKALEKHQQVKLLSIKKAVFE